jgi:phage/plasmid-like protein (TIGR03299 family)
MSHALTIRESGLVEFAYRPEHGMPWHTLGQQITAEQAGDLEHWRTQSGMDWKIQRSKVRYETDRDGSAPQVIEDMHVLFRSDSKSHLGIVSDGYKVVQPAQVVEFFRDYANAGGFELSAMGTINGGRRFWATAKIGEACPVSIRDKINGYLLLATSADGTMATEARFSSTRVVCQNTLQAARMEGKAAVKISHRSIFDAERVKSEMGLNLSAWDEFKADIVRLANKEVNRQQAGELIAGILAGSTKQEEMDKVRDSARSGYNRILALFNGAGMGANMEGVQGTAWGLLNAFTEFADHHAEARSEENRFVSAQWGQNAQLKNRAFSTLLAV